MIWIMGEANFEGAGLARTLPTLFTFPFWRHLGGWLGSCFVPLV